MFNLPNLSPIPRGESEQLCGAQVMLGLIHYRSVKLFLLGAYQAEKGKKNIFPVVLKALLFLHL